MTACHGQGAEPTARQADRHPVGRTGATKVEGQIAGAPVADHQTPGRCKSAVGYRYPPLGGCVAAQHHRVTGRGGPGGPQQATRPDRHGAGAGKRRAADHRTHPGHQRPGNGHRPAIDRQGALIAIATDQQQGLDVQRPAAVNGGRPRPAGLRLVRGTADTQGQRARIQRAGRILYDRHRPIIPHNQPAHPRSAHRHAAHGDEGRIRATDRDNARAELADNELGIRARDDRHRVADRRDHRAFVGEQPRYRAVLLHVDREDAAGWPDRGDGALVHETPGNADPRRLGLGLRRREPAGDERDRVDGRVGQIDGGPTAQGQRRHTRGATNRDGIP